MLIKNSEWTECLPKFAKKIDGRDVSAKGSFAFGECPEFTVEAPRKLGASAVVLRICKDGQPDCDYPFLFTSTDAINDIYTLKVDTASLCGEDEDGLFFYEILFLRGADTLFTSTHNNVDFSLVKNSANRFLMLVHKADMKAPEWFKGRTMYQIFVDRFAKGDGVVESRNDVIINEDWYNGIPQYVEKPGQALKNNMFFGGNLWGVIEKLEYLRSIGVGVIYLNPIFKAYSNHKYDTGNYLEVDGMFGGDKAFDELISKANELDIKIILDGVFNHTGDNSLYFDRYGEYGKKGAYTDARSKYKNWYNFTGGKDEYDCWWGIKILPRLNHASDDCRKFFTGDDGVGAHYIKKGIAGWRLDVADELCDDFLDEFCASVKRESKDDAVIIGEVWENAAEKIAYGKRRRYLRGGQLDSVMNYPLRTGILNFVLQRDAKHLGDVLKSIYSCYPKCVCDSLMNILGTHDTERVLTVLGKGSSEVSWETGSELATKRLTEKELTVAIKRLIIASTIQYTVYGVPSLYYGDEAGVEGYRDPFCRMPYPWGKENQTIKNHYTKLGKIREENRELFAHGEFKVLNAQNGIIAYMRYNGTDTVCVIANATRNKAAFELDGEWTDMLSGKTYASLLSPTSCVVLKKK